MIMHNKSKIETPSADNDRAPFGAPRPGRRSRDGLVYPSSPCSSVSLMSCDRKKFRRRAQIPVTAGRATSAIYRCFAGLIPRGQRGRQILTQPPRLCRRRRDSFGRGRWPAPRTGPVGPPPVQTRLSSESTHARGQTRLQRQAFRVGWPASRKGALFQVRRAQDAPAHERLTVRIVGRCGWQTAVGGFGGRSVSAQLNRL
jgi:hypothetical protein